MSEKLSESRKKLCKMRLEKRSGSAYIRGHGKDFRFFLCEGKL